MKGISHLIVFLLVIVRAATQQQPCTDTVTAVSGNTTSPGYPTTTANMTYVLCITPIQGKLSDIHVIVELPVSPNCEDADVTVTVKFQGFDIPHVTFCGDVNFRYLGAGWTVILETSAVVPLGKGFRVAWDCQDEDECSQGTTNDFNQNSGTFTSQNYPTRYYDDKDCTYVITTPLSDYVIGLYIFDVDLEESDGCANDSIQICDGPNKSQPPIGDPICGTTYPKNYVESTGSSIALQFVTNQIFGGRGFKMFYVSTWDITYTTESGTVLPKESPNLVPLGTETHYVIVTPAGKFTMLTISSVDIPGHPNGDCGDWNILKIQGAPQNGGKRDVAGFCGTHNNAGTWVLKGVKLSLYMSGDDITETGLGFEASYATVDDDVCVDPVELTSPTGEVTSTNYPFPYYNDKTCVYRITVAAGFAVSLRFEAVDLGADCGDKVKVYDGTDTTTTPLVTVCGATIPPGAIASTSNATTPPGTTTSTSNTMTVVFVSDGVFTYEGFGATYETVIPATTTTTPTTTTTTPTTTTTTPTTSTTTPTTTTTTPTTTTTTPTTTTTTPTTTTTTITISPSPRSTTTAPSTITTTALATISTTLATTTSPEPPKRDKVCVCNCRCRPIVRIVKPRQQLPWI